MNKAGEQGRIKSNTDSEFRRVIYHYIKLELMLSPDSKMFRKQL